jgi:hypothetical protein
MTTFDTQAELLALTLVAAHGIGRSPAEAAAATGPRRRICAGDGQLADRPAERRACWTDEDGVALHHQRVPVLLG